jgi:hypothetical protein
LHSPRKQKAVFFHQPRLELLPYSIPATKQDWIHAAEDKETVIYPDYFVSGQSSTYLSHNHNIFASNIKLHPKDQLWQGHCGIFRWTDEFGLRQGQTRPFHLLSPVGHPGGGIYLKPDLGSACFIV